MRNNCLVTQKIQWQKWHHCTFLQISIISIILVEDLDSHQLLNSVVICCYGWCVRGKFDLLQRHSWEGEECVLRLFSSLWGFFFDKTAKLVQWLFLTGQVQRGAWACVSGPDPIKPYRTLALSVGLLPSCGFSHYAFVIWEILVFWGLFNFQIMPHFITDYLKFTFVKITTHLIIKGL